MNQECKWGYEDCTSDKCVLCVTNGLKYEEPKKRYPMRRNTQKADKRMGSGFEFANHQSNEAILSSKMTLNSGATVKEKGDEQITGIIRIMEELKTQMPERARGTKSFAIQRKWLEKLNREAKAENMEFWYLKFAFSEDEGAAVKDSQVYVVVEQDIIMSMVKTMAMDRRKAKEVDAKIDFYQKKSIETEAKNVALKAEIDTLKAQVKMLELQQENKK